MRIFSLPVIPMMLLILNLSACSSGLLSVHKIDVQQGNALNEDSVNQLRVGMVSEQVRFLLGNPMITDPFHGDRWYYVYYFKPGNGPLENLRLTVYFNDGRVTRIEKPGSAGLARRSAIEASATKPNTGL
jgi:outer membrane protein assembly factor BamE